MTSRTKILIDTDPGVGISGTDADDGIALLFALAHPALELVGITSTFGNCPPSLAARCAGAILEATGRRDVPIGIGSPTALNGSLPVELQEAYRGPRGREGAISLPPAPASSRDASDLIIQTVRANPGELTIVALGPQTNLALALLQEPALKDEIASIVFMGGALGMEPTYGRGNVTSVAECNIYFDPEAADIVFGSGIDLTMVSLDVTSPVTGLVLDESDILAIDASRSPAAGLFAQICRTYLHAPMFDLSQGCVLYDPLAVLVAADAAVGAFADMSVRVETQGAYTRGQTVPVRGDANMRVMTKVDGAAAVRQILNTINAL
jgi:inosine-uridine nucleoside N-ribohydrolase